MKHNQLKLAEEYLLTIVNKLVYFGDGHIRPWRSHP